MDDKIQPTDAEQLAKIEKHLNSIKGSVNFFVLLAVLTIVLQGCNLLMGL
jgi:hypothetical protein